jgi:hypothetical protein
MISVVKENDIMDWSYPCLVKSSYDGNIILALEKKGEHCFRGIIIHNSNNSNYHYGEHRNDWMLESFKIFDGELILRNA